MPAKRQKVLASPPRDCIVLDGSDGVQEKTIELNEGEAVAVIGDGFLTVEHGYVLIHGFVAAAGQQTRSRIPLKCDSSSPICIQSNGGASMDATSMGGPYMAAKYAVIRLESRTAPARQGLSPMLRVLESSVRTFQYFHPKEWMDVSDDIVKSIRECPAPGQRSTVCVCGSKNTGKSSICRYLINCLLNEQKTVYLLDIDCGQPEFTPAGMVSLVEVSEPLLEPPYLHRATRPIISHFVGDTSPASDIEHYRRSVLSLYDKARQKEGIIVVNTHGWVQGLGFDVLKECLDNMSITHMIRLHGDQTRHNIDLDILKNHQKGQKMILDYILPAISSSAPSCAAARELRQEMADAAQDQYPKVTNAVEKRNLQWYNFAIQCCHQESMSAKIFDARIPTQLASQAPYSICLKHISVSCVFSSIPQSQLFRVLNGSVVGLCSSKSVVSKNVMKKSRDQPMRCYGMGIVRSVIPEMDLLYLLTPIEEKYLMTVDHLVIGKLDIPSGLLQTESLKSPYLAVHALNTGGTAAAAGKSRNNLLRQRTSMQ